MVLRGAIARFLGLFLALVRATIGVKELPRFDEKAVKLMMLAFISLSRLFYPLSEKEFAQGYCDLFLGVSPLYPAAKYAWRRRSRSNGRSMTRRGRWRGMRGMRRWCRC